ncbi:radical SAM protein [Candidatus Woesearchaeota archaeon]|nr:radical SAM protein [Candidatus Woesearchaeota archaeon]
MKMNNAVYRDFADFQLEIVNSLLAGREPEDIARHAREAIKVVYGHPIPNGAELAMNVNEECNLRCAHCYYASTHDKALEQKKGLLSMEEWQSIIDSSLAAGFKQFSIIGKEPLLSPKITQGILQRVEERKAEYPGVIYEMITNGTLVKDNIHWLKELDFNFLSISFDGYEKDHDKVRGQGSYRRSKEGLAFLRSEGVKNLSVTNTVMPHNVSSLERMMYDLHDAGAEYFSIGFCFPTDYNTASCVVDSMDVFLEALEQLSDPPQGVDISVNLSFYETPGLTGKVMKMLESGKHQFAVTQDLAPSLIIPLRESPRIAIQLNILPVMYYSGFRLDCTGYAMDFCTDLQKPEQRKGFGNVRDTSIQELWKYAREQLWTNHTEEFYRTLADAVRK